MPWSKEKGVTCFFCEEPVPFYYSVMWCDNCLDESSKSDLSMDDFIKSKKGEDWFNGKR